MRARWFLVAVVLAVGAVALLVGLNFWVRGYLRSDAFRELVELRTSRALRADASYEPFRWTGSTVFSNELEAVGFGDGPLVELTAQQARATVNWRAILDGAWRIDRLDIARVDATLRVGKSPGGGEGVPVAKATAVNAEAGWLPKRFEIGEVTVADVNLSMPRAGRLSGSRLTAEPEGTGWIFDGRDGRLALPGREALDVESYRLRLQQGVLYVTEAELRSGESGRVAISGEVGGAKGPFEIRLEWLGVDSAVLVAPEWRGRISGKVSGEVDLTGREGRDALAEGKFFLTEGTLTGLPMQREVALFTRSPQFERIPLHEVSGEFVVDGGRTVVRNFVAESKGLMRLEGEVTTGEGGALAGNLQIGVTPQTLQWLPGSQERVFTESRGGYRWTSLTVGGTVERPTEDLSGRLADATVDEAVETGARLLNEVPERAQDAVKEVLDIFAPLLR